MLSTIQLLNIEPIANAVHQNYPILRRQYLAHSDCRNQYNTAMCQGHGEKYLQIQLNSLSFDFG